MKKLLLSLFLLGNLLSAVAQTIPEANHNVGCSADAGQSGGDALSNVSNIINVLPAGGRTSDVGEPSQQNWGNASTSTATDANNHTIYKFSTSSDNASGGFGFNSVNITKTNYIHIAVYADGDQSIKIRLAYPGGGNGTYTNYQVDTQFKQLHQGWNYLNIPLSDFAYDGANDYKFRSDNVFQVGFVFSAGNKDIYIDDVYFYNLPIVAANHNLGCSADNGQDGGAALSSATLVETVIPTGNRTETKAGELNTETWWNASAEKTNDIAGHTLYKFLVSGPEASGGINFANSIDVEKAGYIHLAVYSEKEQRIEVRVASPSTSDFDQHQKISPVQTLKVGWNYLNISLNDFVYRNNNNNENFDINNVKQVAFHWLDNIVAGTYIDDIYFYSLPPIPSANHNIGCSADTGDEANAVEGASASDVFIAGGDRKALSGIQSQQWNQMEMVGDQIPTEQDAENHTIYKFISTVANASAGLASYDHPVNGSDLDKYVHVALYLPEGQARTDVKIRLAINATGENPNYNNFAVNSASYRLSQGWNYLNIQLDVLDENNAGITSGFAYDGAENFLFDKSKITQLGLIITQSNRTVYMDDAYFYTKPYTTVDDDIENIDWNTKSGTTCWVSKMVALTGQAAPEGQNELQNAADGKNDTYLGITRGDAATFTDADHAYYVVAQLEKPITVSDVEMVWGNGYPLHYEAYALTEAPTTWSVDDLKPLLTNDKRLLTQDTKEVSYEPYFNTISELDGEGHQNEDTKYVVVKMWQPMGNTFGFKLNEIHVGAFDKDYYTPDHISVPNMNFRTEKGNQQPIIPSPRNKRNSVLSNAKITSISYSFKGDQGRYVTINRDGNNANVWASMPGKYTMDIDGSIDNTPVNQGHCVLSVTRDWLSPTTNTPSMIQGLPDANFSATRYQTEEGGANEYVITNIKDRSESTRWSSGPNKASAENQYIAIKLSDDQVYKIRDLEFLWERAYPALYSVYGFETMPDTANVSYSDFARAHSNNLLYQASLDQGVNVFPYHDLHVLGDGTKGTVRELNNTKYLVVAFSEPIQQQNQDYYGVSLWELYAQGTNMTQLNKVKDIHADDMTLYVNRKENFVVQGRDENKQNAIDRLVGATFSGAGASGEALATTLTPSNDNIYHISATLDGSSVEVAQIWDDGNNTYALRTGTDKRIAYHSYNIGVSYSKDIPNTLTTNFILTIIKKPMDLAPNSTETNLVFDDGYYVEQRLEKHASTDVRTIDLTNVDFTTGYDRTTPLSNVEIRAPRYLNKDDNGKKLGVDNTVIGKDLEGKDITAGITIADRKDMNPNAIYYVNQDAFDGTTLKPSSNRIHGENVALKDNSGTADHDWYIVNLRVFDGYDFAPDAPTANTENIRAKRARFYTNIPANRKNTLVFPFNVSRIGFDDVKFYTPSALTMDDDNGKITLTEETGSTASSDNIYIVESGNSRLSSTGGYAVEFQSDPYGDDAHKVDIRKEGASKQLNVGSTSTVATLESSFVQQKLTNDGENKFYTYSSTTDNFRPAGDDWFNYIINPLNAGSRFRGKDMRNTLLQFYACLKVPNTEPSLAKVSWWLPDNTTDGITNINDNKASGLNVNAPMYDVLGRRVNSSYRGIVIQNGKKYVRN